MSAFMVDKFHIDVMVETAIRGPQHAPHPGSWSFPLYLGSIDDSLENATPDMIGRMLAFENARSLRARYQDDVEDMIEHTPYVFTPPRVRLTAVEAIKAINCYEYQACESDDWQETVAAKFCQRLTHHLISHLPGYDAAPWEWTPRQVGARS